MNLAQWQQESGKPVAESIPSSNHCSNSEANNSVDACGGGVEKKTAGSVVRPPKEQPLPCPRCKSTNTKFCYYNNYSLTQPRYFCKGCRRYWTEGGSLRNIPVGGCSRKNKRSPSSYTGVGAKKPFVIPLLQSPNSMIRTPEIESQGLNLTLPTHQQNCRSVSDFVRMSNTSPQTTATSKSHHSALELLTGIATNGMGVGFGGGFSSNSFMPTSDPDSLYASSRLSDLMHDFKTPTLDFSLEYGLGNRQSSSEVWGTSTQNDHQISTSGGGRVLVSQFDNFKNQQQVDHHHLQYEQQADQNRSGHGVTKGYWTEMLGDSGRSDW